MRLTHPPLLVLTDTPGKLNNLASALPPDLDRKAHWSYRAGALLRGALLCNSCSVGFGRGVSPAPAARKETSCL